MLYVRICRCRTIKAKAILNLLLSPTNNCSDSDYWFLESLDKSSVHLSSRVVDIFARLISGDITTRILAVSDRPGHLHLCRPLLGLCAQRGQQRTDEESCFLLLSIVHDHELHVGCLWARGLRRVLFICTLFCCKCPVIYVCVPCGDSEVFYCLWSSTGIHPLLSGPARPKKGWDECQRFDGCILKVVWKSGKIRM